MRVVSLKMNSNVYPLKNTNSHCLLLNTTIPLCNSKISLIFLWGKHKEKLPKDTPILFFKRIELSWNALTLLSTDAGNSSEALSSKQMTISVCTNKQLVTKGEIIWALDVVMSKYLFNSSSNKSDLFTTMFLDSRIAKNFFVWKDKMWVHCEIWNCTLLCWTIEFPVERCRIFCYIIWWIL